MKMMHVPQSRYTSLQALSQHCQIFEMTTYARHYAPGHSATMDIISAKLCRSSDDKMSNSSCSPSYGEAVPRSCFNASPTTTGLRALLLLCVPETAEVSDSHQTTVAICETKKSCRVGCRGAPTKGSSDIDGEGVGNMERRFVEASLLSVGSARARGVVNGIEAGRDACVCVRIPAVNIVFKTPILK